MQAVLVIAIVSLLLWTLLPQPSRSAVEDLSVEEVAPALQPREPSSFDPSA